MPLSTSDLDLKAASRIMRALGHENRLSLYREIAAQTQWSTTAESVICDIAASLRIGAPTVSHHVKELERAGLIITQRQGKLLTARINPSVHQWVQAFFNHSEPLPIADGGSSRLTNPSPSGDSST